MATIPILPTPSVTPNSRPSLLKNIKNLPTVSNKNKINNNFVTLSNNGKNQSTKKSQQQFLQATPYSLSVPKDIVVVESTFQELQTSDLLSSPSIENLSSVDNASLMSSVVDSDVVPAPSASPVRRRSDSAPRITYTAEFMLSLRHQVDHLGNRPSELEFVDQSQREAALLQSSLYSSTTSYARTPLFGTPVTPMNHYGMNPSPFKSAGPSMMSIPMGSPFAIGTNSPFSQSMGADNSRAGVIPMRLRIAPLPLPLSVPLPLPLPTPTNNNKSFNAGKKQAKTSKTNVDNKRSREEELPLQQQQDGTTDLLVEGMKKVLKEDNAKRLQARQRQIDIGKATVGYQQYVSAISKSKRKKTDPKTPTKSQICSKRSWDGQVRKWRRLLHAYDPSGTKLDEDLLMDDEQDDEEITTCTAEAIPQISSVYDSITPEMLA